MNISEANKLRILYFLAFSCTASWLPIFADYLKERGLNGIQIGVILSVTPVMMFLVQPLQRNACRQTGIQKMSDMVLPFRFLELLVLCFRWQLCNLLSHNRFHGVVL